jgi:hypothetical protein
MPRGEVDHQPDQRFGLLFTVLAVGGTGGLVLWTWTVRDRLPDQIAHHWGSGGQATSTTDLTTILVMSVVLPLMTSLPLALAAVFGRQALALRRCLAAVSSFLVAFITVLIADSLRGQLGLEDGISSSPPGLGIGLGLLIGAGVALLAAAVVRNDPQDVTARKAAEPPPATAPRLAGLVTGPWEAPPTGIDTSALVTSLVALAAVTSWWLALLAPPLLVLSGLAARFRVRVDVEGLHATAVGRRIVHVPIVEVARAEVVDLDPFWEFGGWGLRVDVAGRVGIVTRKGPALRVVRGDGSEVLITIDEAQVAAATLNTLAEQRHADTTG